MSLIIIDKHGFRFQLVSLTVLEYRLFEFNSQLGLAQNGRGNVKKSLRAGLVDEFGL